MRKAKIFVHNREAGILFEYEKGGKYSYKYHDNYDGEPVSVTIPLRPEPYNFDQFPPFFDGLLPEGYQLESLLRIKKIDRDDLFSQLMATGKDMVGAVTVEEL